MSGFLKSVGKVFKKIVKSPIFKAVLIGAAIYFTAGLALGAMGVAGAAALPGVSALAGAVGLGEVGAFGAAALGTVGVEAGAAAMSTGLGLLGGETAAGVAAAETGAGIIGGEALAGGGIAATAAAAPSAAGTGFGVGGFDAATEAALSSGVAGAPGASTGASFATGGSWMDSLTAGAKDLLGNKFAMNALSEGGKAVINSIGQKASLDQQKQEYDQSRADIIRRSGVPDISGQITPKQGYGAGSTPGSYQTGYTGIVNSAVATPSTIPAVDPNKKVA